MTIDEIRETLQDRNYKVIALRTGIKYPTILRIANGTTTYAKIDVLDKLTEYFENGVTNK